MRNAGSALVVFSGFVAGCAAISFSIAACAPSEGPLFRGPGDAGKPTELPDAGADAQNEAPDADAQATEDASVRPGMRLQYQLVGTLDPNADAELFVVDLFETKRDDIERLHALGRVVIAFVAAGSYEPWRPDVDALPKAVIGKPLAGYPDEAWLDVRDPSVRQLLVGRLTLAVDKGFDGVLLVSLDGYLADSGHALSAADQLAYNIWLAERAAQVGLAVGISSDWAQAARLADYYHFAIHLNCLLDRRCAELDVYRERGRAVFDLETSGEAESVCAEASRLQLPVTLKKASFDGWFLACR